MTNREYASQNREYIIAANWFKYRIVLYAVKQWERYYMTSTSSKIPKLYTSNQTRCRRQWKVKTLKVPRTPLGEKETHFECERIN